MSVLRRRRFTGELVKKYRKKYNVSAYELSKVLNVSRQFVYAVEKGKKDIPLSRVALTCFVLKIPPEIMQQAILRGKMIEIREKF